MNPQLEAVIKRLEEMSKQGESYDDKGAHGWRNPIRADTGAILSALTLAKDPKRVLEIGTAYGLSGCYIGASLKDAEFHTIEWDKDVAAAAQQNFNDAGLKVTVHAGNALEVIKTFELPFDLVFLDANKSGYADQFQELQERGLLLGGCLILADNVIDRKEECQPFLDRMEQYNPVILGTVCGLLVAKV